MITCLRFSYGEKKKKNRFQSFSGESLSQFNNSTSFSLQTLADSTAFQKNGLQE